MIVLLESYNIVPTIIIIVGLLLILAAFGTYRSLGPKLVGLIQFYLSITYFRCLSSGLCIHVTIASYIILFSRISVKQADYHTCTYHFSQCSGYQHRTTPCIRVQEFSIKHQQGDI